MLKAVPGIELVSLKMFCIYKLFGTNCITSSSVVYVACSMAGIVNRRSVFFCKNHWLVFRGVNVKCCSVSDADIDFLQRTVRMVHSYRLLY